MIQDGLIDGVGRSDERRVLRVSSHESEPPNRTDLNLLVGDRAGYAFGSFEHLLFGLVDEKPPFDRDHGFWAAWRLLNELLCEKRWCGG